MCAALDVSGKGFGAGEELLGGGRVQGRDFQRGVGFFAIAGDFDSTGREPSGGAADLIAAAGGGGIGAFGVLDGTEFLGAVGDVDQGIGGQGNGVEDELFKLDGVGAIGLEKLAAFVESGDFFLGAMPGHAHRAAGVEAFDEGDGQGVDGD